MLANCVWVFNNAKMADAEAHPALRERTLHGEGVDNLAIAAIGVLNAIQKAIEGGTHDVEIFSGTRSSGGRPYRETPGPSFQVVQTAEQTTVTLGSVTIKPVTPGS